MDLAATIADRRTAPHFGARSAFGLSGFVGVVAGVSVEFFQRLVADEQKNPAVVKAAELRGGPICVCPRSNASTGSFPDRAGL